MNDIKLEFIRQTLEKRGKDIQKTMQEGIHYNQYLGEGRMEDSIKMQTQQQSAEGTLSITTVGYLRMQDILATRKDSASALRKKTSKNPHTKNRKGFYTKTIYGYLTPIIRDLSFGLTQEVIDDIRNTFNP